MKEKITQLVIFAIGVGVGAVASMTYFKTKYEQIAQEEIDSVKETFSKLKSKEEKTTSDDISEEKKTLINIVNKHDYTSFSKSNVKKEEKPLKEDKPYVISPMQVGDDDFDCITLTLYSNNVLTNELDERIEGGELKNLIGSEDVFEHFGDYEDDVIYVRNERLKTDFEILRVLDSYEEVDE